MTPDALAVARSLLACVSPPQRHDQRHSTAASYNQTFPLLARHSDGDRDAGGTRKAILAESARLAGTDSGLADHLLALWLFSRPAVQNQEWGFSSRHHSSHLPLAFIPPRFLDEFSLPPCMIQGPVIPLANSVKVRSLRLCNTLVLIAARLPTLCRSSRGIQPLGERKTTSCLTESDEFSSVSLRRSLLSRF